MRRFGHRITVANEGLGWDALASKCNNPGGDWHPGWGSRFKLIQIILGFTCD